MLREIHTIYGGSYLGYLWVIIQGMFINKSIAAVSGNKNLLTFPQVTPLDLIIARTLVLVATEIIVANIMLLSSYVLGYNLGPISWSGILISLFYITAISFGLGIILAAFCHIVPTVAQIVPMILRLLLF